MVSMSETNREFAERAYREDTLAYSIERGGYVIWSALKIIDEHTFTIFEVYTQEDGGFNLSIKTILNGVVESRYQQTYSNKVCSDVYLTKKETKEMITAISLYLQRTMTNGEY
jgi:hypothetical protein